MCPNGANGPNGVINTLKRMRDGITFLATIRLHDEFLSTEKLREAKRDA